jgi:hypothetical protein
MDVGMFQLHSFWVKLCMDKTSGGNNKRKRNENGSSSSTGYHRESTLRTASSKTQPLVQRPDNAKILVGGVAHFEKESKVRS